MFKGNRNGKKAAGSRPPMVVESLEGRRLFASDYHAPLPEDWVKATDAYVQPKSSDVGMAANGLGDDAQIVAGAQYVKEPVEKLDPTAVEYAKAEPPPAP